MGRLDAILAYSRSIASMPRMGFVYAICDVDGVPVYVGCSTQPKLRYLQHKRAGKHRELWLWLARNWRWHTFEILDQYSGIRAMHDAEHEYIRYLMPRFNRAGLPRA